MKGTLIFIGLISGCWLVESLPDALTKGEIADLRKRLAVVKEESVREARKIAEVRQQEAEGLGREFAACVSRATKELEEGVVKELEARIGVLDKELASDKPLDREQVKSQVETATVGAGVAVEKRTTTFIMKALACSQKHDEARKNIPK